MNSEEKNTRFIRGRVGHRLDPVTNERQEMTIIATRVQLWHLLGGLHADESNSIIGNLLFIGS